MSFSGVFLIKDTAELKRETKKEANNFVRGEYIFETCWFSSDKFISEHALLIRFLFLA